MLGKMCAFLRMYFASVFVFVWMRRNDVLGRGNENKLFPPVPPTELEYILHTVQVDEEFTICTVYL